MDTVTDLTARAVAFIGAIQELCVCNAAKKGTKVPDLFEPSEEVHKLLQKYDPGNDLLHKRAIELIWISKSDPNQERISIFFLRRAKALMEWIWDQKDFKALEVSNLHPPEQWRNSISGLLYRQPGKGTELAALLHYLPLQVILALGGGKYKAKTQRILQEWQTPEEELKAILSAADLKIAAKCHRIDPADAETLLKDDEMLIQKLKKLKVPLSFELILQEELKEIKENRIERQLELERVYPGKSIVLQNENLSSSTKTLDIKSNDPFVKAKSMQLMALAFSGGGIRSATFNLGVLQAFAQAGLLEKFDYLSTVSGGGYIGSWLAAWIKREGSVTKVSNRLDPQKSPDPQAEEVRPIRWLRMYSNYLAPEASIMSADSWTVGATIVRNMLLNQLIIALLLFTLLLAGKLLFLLWSDYLIPVNNSDRTVFICCSAIILLGAIYAGAGMGSYSKNKTHKAIMQAADSELAAQILLILGLVTAFIASAWMFSKWFPAATGFISFLQTLVTLNYATGIGFVALLIVTFLGRYYECIPYQGICKVGGCILIVLFSLIAALMGAVFLVWGWQLVSYMAHAEEHYFHNSNKAMSFIFGFPIALEVLSLTVVTRMALLGKFFPDERREWWGRMGGIVHRIAFLWILIAGAALLGEPIVNRAKHIGINLAAAAGGWAAVILAAVKAGFSTKTSGKNEPGILSSALNMLARTGPYLFGLGLLVFMPKLLDKILDNLFPEHRPVELICFFVALAIITIILAWRVGANEFSMHHFYKNRLMRAYLGATRRRTDRIKTANTFTGFDTRDDLLLKDLTHAHRYFGPYPLVNATLNATEVSDSSRQDRKAESFIFSPLYCGFDFSRTRPSANVNQKSYAYAYRPAEGYAYPDGPHIGSAMAISGAAANPNQGYHSSPATAFLLTAFNVRLGWWIGNPRKSQWTSADPPLGLTYIIYDLIGKSNTDDQFVCLSDGGHFDNMGLYELIRRKVKVIVLGDAEQDSNFTCEGLANAIRRCRIDFGVEIDINVAKITRRKKNLSSQSYEIGRIKYPGESQASGILIYLKSSITENEPVDVREYSVKNPEFPHQTTGDQFFDEPQFESYRKLGFCIAQAALADKRICDVFNPDKS